MPESRETAEKAGLRYLLDEGPGIRRRRRGRGWSYYRTDGSLIAAPADRKRFDSLAIPPVWSEIWISPDPLGHLQASGRDDRGRKQYRYHDLWDEARDALKRDRLLELGHALPRLRRKTRRALSETGLGREKVSAPVVALFQTTPERSKVGRRLVQGRGRARGSPSDDPGDVTWRLALSDFREDGAFRIAAALS